MYTIEEERESLIHHKTRCSYKPILTDNLCINIMYLHIFIYVQTCFLHHLLIQIIQDALWAFLYLCEDGKNMYWEKVPQDITYGFMKVCTQMLGVDIDSELMV